MKSMKKGLAILLAILLLVSVGTVLGFAGGNRNGAPDTAVNAASTCPVTTVTDDSATTTAGKGYRYTDANDDGLCDNAGSGNGYRYVDADGDGICNNAGSGNGYRYADADGDGICDNAGSGNGYRYVDADGDGICDNAGNGNANGRAYHQQQNGAGHCAKGRTGSSCQANRK